jgi:S-adenosylmethionine:diacylglycerol 3-amino-3-carboxypropyl transferase
MHEDAEIEQEAFRGAGRVFCIASAGDTALRLAEQHEVVACDINPVQLAYAERRARGGPLETGEAERIMAFARFFMPLVGWRAEVVHAFLSLSDVAEQMTFWHEHLDTRRFRASLDFLLSRTMLRAAYAPRFLSVLPRRFGTVLRNRLRRGFARHPNAGNPYAHTLFLGVHSSWFRPKSPNIRFVHADAASWLESCPAGFLNAFSLSNILDGAEPAYAMRLSKAVRHAASKDALVVMRSFAEPPPKLSTNHAERDRSMLWGIVTICPAQAL